MFLAGPNHGGDNKEDNMARRRSTLRPSRARFGGTRGYRRQLARSFTRAFRATGGGWGHKAIRKVLSTAGVRFN